MLATQEKLHHTLTQEVADRLDGDLRELAVVPLTMATLLENRRDWDEEQLDRALKDMLDKTPLIFGLCVAFEPHQWRPDREDFAHYVFRRREGLAVKQLLPPAYRPIYREWAVVSSRRKTPRKGAGASPISAKAATARRWSLSPRPSTAMAVSWAWSPPIWPWTTSAISAAASTAWIWGPKSYCFVVSSGQRILAHPVARYEFPGRDSDLAKNPLDASFRELGQPVDAHPGGNGPRHRLLHRPAGIISCSPASLPRAGRW